MNSNYSCEIASCIRDFMIDHGMDHEFDEEEGIFRLDHHFPGRIRSLQEIVDVREDFFITYAFFPITANPQDPEQMANIAEAICRTNYGLISGNFELDFHDGEIRYKVYVNCDGIVPSEQIIKEALYTPIAIIYKQYGERLLQILERTASPSEAIEGWKSDLLYQPADEDAEVAESSDSDLSDSFSEKLNHLFQALGGSEDHKDEEDKEE